MVFLLASFAPKTAEKRLDLKRLKGQTKAVEVEDLVPELLRLRLPPKAFQIEPFRKKNSCKIAEPRVHRTTRAWTPLKITSTVWL